MRSTHSQNTAYNRGHQFEALVQTAVALVAELVHDRLRKSFGACKVLWLPADFIVTNGVGDVQQKHKERLLPARWLRQPQRGSVNVATGKHAYARNCQTDLHACAPV